VVNVNKKYIVYAGKLLKIRDKSNGYLDISRIWNVDLDIFYKYF